MREMPTALSNSFRAEAEEDTARLPLTSLIDIVFLLIAFFMLTTELIEAERDPAVELPRIEAAAVYEETPGDFVINVLQDGVITVAGLVVPEERLRELLARLDEGARVVLRVDKRLRYRDLDKTIQMCQREGISVLTLRATTGESP